jgi:glycosyltransferase involved in cell wall biosynthesis
LELFPQQAIFNGKIFMRVILVADNASTKFGGEAFIPFNYFRLLRARKVDVRLVVHARNKAELLEHFPEDIERVHFVEDTWLHRTLFRLGTSLPNGLADATTGVLIHLTTQIAQRRMVRDLVRVFRVDVVHQPIPVSPKTPSLIYRVGAPVIIGPLNGGMDYPPAFKKARGLVSALALPLGRFAANFLNIVVPGKRHANLILVANRRTQNALPWGIKGTVVELVDNGVDLKIWRQKKSCESSDVLRLIFVGRLIDLKALDLIVEAIHRLEREVNVTLEVVGDGPMRHHWQHLAKRLGLDENIRFSGFLSQEECAHRLRQSDVFVMPSLHDCGGAVVLEAMATSLPVIATAWGGPLDYLDDHCGILVRPLSREALVDGFSTAIRTLAKSLPLRTQLGQAAYDRALRYFDWERKIDQMLGFYADVSKRPSQH